MKTLTVRNEVQKALLICELQGQISDGMWENASPQNHWRVWGNLNNETVEVGENVGKNFYAEKDNYNLNSSTLLDIIGDRMIAICNMVENGYDLDVINKFNDYHKPRHLTLHIKVGMTNEEIVEAYNSDYWVKKDNEMMAVFGSAEKLEEARTGSYDMKKLKKELADLKMIFKTNK